MNVISIDFSKVCTGVFTRVAKKENSFCIVNKAKMPQQKALENIYDSFSIILEKDNFHFGLIEGYGFNPVNKHSMVPMSEIGGVIKLIFAQKGIDLVTVPIQTWKSVTGMGKIDKRKNPDLYLQTIETRYGKAFSNIDMADAYLIYHAAWMICQRTSYLSKSMRTMRDRIIAIRQESMIKEQLIDMFEEDEK